MSEGETIAAAPTRKLTAKNAFLTIAFTILLGTGAIFGLYHYRFPYGWSHCCDILLGRALVDYAEDHGGKFPSGGDTPEASLSLLYSNYADANLLRGKTIPLEKVERALAANGKLGPETCGWHYVEGLTLSDDPSIAIVWDKVGLGHNGERSKNGGHSIIRADGTRDFVSGAAWPQFLQEQQERLAHRNDHAVRGLPVLTARIQLPTGEVLTNCPGSYELAEDSSASHGSQSGSGLNLRWYRVNQKDGQTTWTLTLPDRNLRSKPVTFKITNGLAYPDSITFEMEEY